MTPALSIFDFQEQPVRIFDQNGAPWFVAADVCRVLEIANSRDAMKSLEDDEKGVATTDTLGGAQKSNIINESGLYALIFKSRKPQAKAFRKWVTSEVLPALRRTGQYSAAKEQPAAEPKALENGVTIPGFLEADPVARALPIKDRIRVGRLCKQFGAAMGGPTVVAVDPRYGRLRSYPEPLCRDVLEDVMRSKSVQTSTFVEMQALVTSAAETCGHGAQFTIAELFAFARHKGMHLNGSLDSGPGTDPAQFKSMGRRLQAICVREFQDSLGRTFVIRKWRKKHGVTYVVNFHNEQ